MPNNQVIEERIVEMRLDNKNFESGANKTISLLEKLEKALHIKSSSKDLDEAANSIERLGNAANKFNANGMTEGLEKIKSGFTALEIVGMRTISNLTDSIYNFTTKTLKSFTVEPIQAGFGKYGEKTTAVATLTAQGYELEKVNQLMEALNWFTDETSYNFTDMVGNIAKFTATGQDLDESVTAMEGIALWAALSGQNAQKASMAMYQLSQAMGKGALKYDDYKSIQNASMDTQEFRKQAVAAAEELGVLRQSAEGLWEVIGEGKEFDLAGLFSSDALSRTQWFTSDVMMRVFNQYSKAVGEVQRYMDENGFDTASEAMKDLEARAQELTKTGITLDEAFKQLGYDLDEFSIKAFKAGQNARTWTDVVDSVKDAVSTGWMSTFEKFFGDAETATKFWTDLANEFYDIFAEGGNTRNEILKKALLGKTEGLTKTAGATKNLVSGWEKLEKRLESSGHDMHDFEEALIKVSDEGTIEAVRGFGSVEEALRNGAFSADIFKRALAELTGETTEAGSEVEAQANASAKSLDDMRQVALEVLRGDHGNGQERVDWLKENGYDPELIQAMAGQLKWFGNNISDERLIDLMEAYYRFNNLGDRLGAKTFAEYVEASSKVTDEVEATNGALSDAESLYDAVVNGVDETAESLEDAKTGGELFRESLLNIVALIKSIQDVSRAAFEKIFGDEDDIASGIYKVIKGFHSFTEAIQLNEDQSVALKAVFMGIFTVIKAVGKVAGAAIRIFGALFRAGLSVLTFVGQLIGMLKENTAIQHFAKAFYNLFEAIAKPVSLIVHYIDLMTRPFRKTFMANALEKIAHFIGIISIRAAYLTEKFKDFMTSDAMFMRITNAFRSLVSYIRNIKDTVSNFKFGTFLSGAWQTVKNLFSSVSNFVRSGDLTSFSGFSAKFKELGASISQIKIGKKSLSDIFKPVTDFFTNILGDPEVLKGNISAAITKALSGIKEALKKLGITDVFKALKFAALTVLWSRLNGILKSFKKIEDEISGVPEALSGVFKSLSGVFDEYKKSLKANNYLKMAAAIGILAASLWVLSTIPADELTHVVAVMGVLVLVLSVLARNLQGIVKVIGGDQGSRLKINVFNGLAAKLVGLAALILSVVAMLSVVKKANPQSLAITLVGLVVLIGGLALVLREMSKMQFADTKGLVATMLSLALAIQMLIIPIAALAAMPFTKYLQGVLGLAAVATILGTVLFVFSRLDNKGNTQNIMKVAAAMSLIAVALLLMTVPFAILAAIPVDNFGKALASMLGFIALLTLMGAAAAIIGRLNEGKGILMVAAALVILSAALLLLTPALLLIAGATATFIYILGSLDDKAFSKFEKGLTRFGKLAGKLALFGAALIVIGVGALLTGAGLTAFAGGAAILTLALAALIFVLPRFVDAMANMKELTTGDVLRSLGKIVLMIVAVAVAIGVLTLAFSKLYKIFTGRTVSTIGASFLNMLTGFVTKAKTGVKNIFTSISNYLKDPNNRQVILAAIEGMIVVVGLYIAELLPTLVRTIFGAVITLVDSLATEIENNKDAFVNSLTRMLKALMDVVTELLLNVFSKDFWDSLNDLEKVLFVVGTMLATIKSISSLMKLATPFIKLTEAITGSGGVIAAFGSVVGWILLIGALILGIRNEIKYLKEEAEEVNEIKEERLYGEKDPSIDERIEKLKELKKTVQDVTEEIEGMPAQGKTKGEINNRKADLLKLESDLALEQETIAKLIAEATGESYNKVLKRVRKTDDITELDEYKQYQQILEETVKAQEELNEAKSEQYNFDDNRILKRNTAVVEGSNEATQAEVQLEQQITSTGSAIETFYGKLSELGYSKDTNFGDIISELGFDKVNSLLTESGIDINLGDLLNIGGENEFQQQLKEAGIDVGPYLTEGVGEGTTSETGLNALYSKLGDMKNMTLSKVMELFGISSPSEVMANEVGQYIPAGIGLGAEKNQMAAISPLSTILANMLSLFGNVSTRFYNSGVSIVQGLINGISANMQSAYNIGANLADSVKNGFNDALEIHSPSKVFENLAKFIPLGVAKGIEDNEDSAIQSITVLSNDLINEIYKAMSDVAYIASDDFSISPTITPVVDMTNARMAAGSMNTMFGSNYRSYVDGITARAGDVSQSVDYNLHNKEVVSEVRSLSNRLDLLGDKITNMQIVLDSGLMVGAMAPQMDSRLGQIAVRKGRGN